MSIQSLRQQLLQLLLLRLEAFAQIVKHLLRTHVGDVILCDDASTIKQQTRTRDTRQRVSHVTHRNLLEWIVVHAEYTQMV